MHKPLFLVTAAGVAAAGGLIFASALPAAAATAGRAETMALYQNGPGPTEDTPVTFTVGTNGTLNITVPSDTVNLGSGLVDTIIGPTALGPVVVTDFRATNPSDWTAVVSSTDFVNQSNPTDKADDILAGAATYTTGTVGADTTTGSGLPLAAGITNNGSGGITLANAVTGPPVGTPIVTETGADGDNAAQWDPTIAVAVPALAVTGIYDGTITHSVS